jgi:hypothetical protein
MMLIDQFRKIAMSFPEANEEPHFEKTSFRVARKIFATYNAKNNLACLKLPLTEQDVFSKYDPEAVYPVPNSWGKQGWTFVKLDMVHPDLFEDALTTAYCSVAPPKLAKLVR